ncbi:hypothetical protein BH23ACT4_BH23ACT4_05210 [soil metagenome]
MRVERSVTSISWIPSEAIPGTFKVPFLLGIGHYDPPPPDHIEDLTKLHDNADMRYANQLRAFIEVDGYEITDAGYTGGGLVSDTIATLGPKQVSFPPVVFPELQKDPEFGDGWVRFVQTVGARTGVPMPRKVSRPPYLQFVSPTTWTTLGLKIHADGTHEQEIVGASPFPRHWFYDDNGDVVEKSGVADYDSWAGENWGDNTPWGEHEQELVTAQVETALERTLSKLIMQGDARPKIRRIGTGETLTEQGEGGSDLYLVLDGMLTVEVDGEPVAEVGPGAILGERAILEGGKRTSTLRASTPGKVAVARPDQIDREALVELAAGHRREEA